MHNIFLCVCFQICVRWRQLGFPLLQQRYRRLGNNRALCIYVTEHRVRFIALKTQAAHPSEIFGISETRLKVSIGLHNDTVNSNVSFSFLHKVGWNTSKSPKLRHPPNLYIYMYYASWHALPPLRKYDGNKKWPVTWLMTFQLRVSESIVHIVSNAHFPLT